MINSIYSPTYARISRLIRYSRFNEAFSLIKNSLTKIKLSPEETARIESLENTYKYLLKYLAAGHEDPSRQAMLDEILNGLNRANDLLLQASLLQDSSDVYSTVKRMEILKGSDLNSRFSEFIKELENEIDPQEKGNEREDRRFISLELLFNHVLTLFGEKKSEYDKLGDYLLDPALPDYVKASLVGALLLGNTKYFEPESLKILFKAYEVELSPMLKGRIVASIALLSLLYSERISKESLLRKQTEELKGNKEFIDAMNNVLKEIVRVFDTKRVTEKMRNEVIPGLMKINPDIIEKMRNIAADSDDFLSDSNPEWEEIIEESGIQDKLSEINDMQQDGSDVMMTTFANLKNFPFFKTLSNWFLPFLPDHPELESLNVAHDEAGIDKLSLAMCDSDIYSFLLSLKGMPEGQRNMMLKNMASQMKHAEEMLTTAVGDTEETQLKRTVRFFLQDLNRFFKLFRRRDDFDDPFATPVSGEMLSSLINLYEIKNETLLEIGDFYFKHQYFKDSADVYELLNKLDSGDFSLWEKIGYCYGKMKQFEKAVEWYRKAEIVSPDNEWLEKKLAVSLKNNGEYEEALRYYGKILEREPDNFHVLMSAAQCCLESGRHEEALRHFYHADYVKPDKISASRGVAWTLLVSGKSEKAAQAYERLLGMDSSDKSDYFNAALCMLVLNNYNKAIRHFKTFLRMTGQDYNALMTALKEDAATLKDLGIPSANIRLVVDCLKYGIE